MDQQHEIKRLYVQEKGGNICDMIYELKLSDKLLRENGYTTVFLQTENIELLLFYKASSEETTIFGLSYSTDSLKKYIDIGYLFQSTNDIEFGCYPGIKKESFTEDNLLERIKLVEDEISKSYSIKVYDELMRDNLKFNDAEQVVLRYIKQFCRRETGCEVRKRNPKNIN